MRGAVETSAASTRDLCFILQARLHKSLPVGKANLQKGDASLEAQNFPLVPKLGGWAFTLGAIAFDKVLVWDLANGKLLQMGFC